MVRDWKNRKTSLKKKILNSSIAVLLLLAVVMGTTSVYVVDSLSTTASRKIMSQFCEKETLRFDSKLSIVRHSVEMIYEYTKELQRVKGWMDIYSNRYTDYIEDFAVTIANHTDGAMAVYFRYNPEQTGNGTDGFLWTRENDLQRFQEREPTDILAYSSDDISHVGWFYVPKEAGEAMWMAPYYNQNLQVFMISYIIPLFKVNGEFIGVIGMDIDFSYIISQSHSVHIYDSGSMAWLDIGSRHIYFSDESGHIQTQDIPDALYWHLTEEHQPGDLLVLRNSQKGTASVICCQTLSNGMMLLVNVPKQEIDKNRNYLMFACILITVFMFVLTSAVMQERTRKIVKPLEKLTEITKQYADGDWSSQYVAHTQDEVQTLSEGISQMAQNTQNYLKTLNALARTDPTTGVGNKTSYLERVVDIKKNRHSLYDAYAVVAMDLNLLKKTNDTYGHEAGDFLIREAAAYICRTFARSPAFRTGGDEFVVILYADDYQNRAELLRKFEAGMPYAIPGMAHLTLSIAFGMAEYPQDDTDYDRVFELADERMYQKKKERNLNRAD